MQQNALQLILQSGLFVKVILLILLGFSMFTWTIIYYKHTYLAAAGKETAKFLGAFHRGSGLKELADAAKACTVSPAANVFTAVHAARSRTSHDDVKRLLHRYEALEAAKLNSYLTFLATTGSTTPFIGLLGTVWGIMNAFRGIAAADSASLSVVAPGIAEALITTAAGLAAAIPAVMAYNYYVSRARRAIIEMEDFSEELLELFAKRPA